MDEYYSELIPIPDKKTLDEISELVKTSYRENKNNVEITHRIFKYEPKKYEEDASCH